MSQPSVEIGGEEGIDLLVLSELFPDPIRYQRGLFVVEEAAALSVHCRVSVIAPVRVPMARAKFRARRRVLAQIPPKSRLRDGTVYRPRFLDSPRFSTYLNDYFMLLATMRCIWRHRIKVSIIHSHFAYPSGYVGVKLGQLLRKPAVLTVHGSDVHQRTRPDHPHRVARQRTLVALSQADRIIAVSRALRTRVVELGSSPDKVFVLRGGFVKSRFAVLDRKLCREKLELKDRGRLILFVGNLVGIKGVKVLLEAMSQLRKDGRDVVLVIVGDGPLGPQLKAYAEQLGLAGRVLWKGQMPNERVAEFMGASDVFVLPSLNEGLPTVCLEALASGRPVVASRVGGIPEIVHESRCGILVEPGNAEMLARAIACALERDWDPTSLAAYVEQYGWESVASQVCVHYRQVLDRA